ncbi:acyltransferase family protein [Pedococcus bigeumensis]|uniref:acyltransferase family protein n=1 Tax=Pedococcus bigeumensis TaxID=433644 RepID=UPI001387156D|nr:acyltransferase family protein [Pedococcus bigeumensis]
MGTTHPHRQLAYLPALDGLRAFAVTAVVLYHLNLPLLPGGYLGVDVFFVISGFLITALLLAELDRWGSVDLAAFWIRRVRRLLPALLLVMVAVVAYAQFLAQPAQRAQLRGDGFATLLYYSNWRFIYAGESYFAQYGDPSPLRHTWSLAIEEQWYLVLPLVLTGLAALGFLSRRALAAGFALGAVASALWAAHLYNPDVDPSRVYYGTDTRVQGLLTGACLAALLGSRAWAGRARTSKGQVRYLALGPWTLPLGRQALAHGVGIAGLGAVAAAMLFLPDSSSFLYRGGFLVVALASGAVIYASRLPGPLATLLSLPPLRWLGRISYGVYLWHWPVIVVLSSERTGLGGLGLALVRIAVTLGLSELSYRLVELPVRRGALRRFPRRAGLRPWLVAGVPAVLVTSLVLATPPDPSSSRTVDGLTVSQHVAPAGDRRVLLVGDSTAFTLAMPWSAALTPGVTVTSSTRLGCGFARGGRLIGDQRYAQEEKCAQWPTDWADAVRDSDPELVLLMAGAWETVDHVVEGRVLKVGSQEYGDYLRTELDAASSVLTQRGARLGLVNVPCYQEPDGGMYGPDLVRQRNDRTRIAWINTQYQRYAEAHPETVSVVHLETMLCDEQGRPLATIGGVAAKDVRYDGVHYTEKGAKDVWRWLDSRLLQTLGSNAPLTAYFVGDSVPYGLREDSGGRHGSFTLAGATRLGCGLVTSPRVVAGRVEAMPDACSEWSASWPDQARQSSYDVGVLWPGIGELFDHRVKGRTLRFGSESYRRYLQDEYGRAIDALSSDGRPVVVVTMPCHGVPDGDGREAPAINDAERIAWINDVAREVAAAHGASVVDLGGHLCAGGYSNTSGNVTLRKDGLHFTEAGTTLVLSWLLPQISRSAGLTKG